MYVRPRIIPCLLVYDGNLVKTKKFSKPEYLGDPINAVKIFNEENVDELCLLDISPYKNKQIDFDLLENIASEAFMPLSYGGGINSLQDAKRLYRLGFEKLVFNTAIFNNSKLISEVVGFAGAQSVVASIDVKKNIWGRQYCYVQCGKQCTKMNPEQYVKRAENLGVGEIFLNSIDNDGMMRGYDVDLIREISSSTQLPLIACGGAGSTKDLKMALDSGASAVSAGSIFVYYGPRRAVLINYPHENEFLELGIYRKLE